jgi:hypothetical protein
MEVGFLDGGRSLGGQQYVPSARSERGAAADGGPGA